MKDAFGSVVAVVFCAVVLRLLLARREREPAPLPATPTAQMDGWITTVPQTV